MTRDEVLHRYPRDVCVDCDYDKCSLRYPRELEDDPKRIAF